MSITWMKVDVGSKVVADHFNIVDNVVNKLHGGGLQDMASQMIWRHTHVDPDLMAEKFGESHVLLGRLPANIWESSSGSRKIGGFELLSTQLTSRANQNKLAYFLLHWDANGDTGDLSLGNFDIQNFVSGTKFAFDSSAPNHLFYTGANKPTLASTDAAVKYGFDLSTLFAGPLNPYGIQLTNDVGNNDTFAQHIADGRIHKRRVTSPSPTSDNDHLNCAAGFINIYDIADGSIDYGQTTRLSDGFTFDVFDSDVTGLDQIANPVGDIRHPALYDAAGILIAQQGKLRQYKLIKGFPDDMQMAEAARAAAPLDSLFVGGGPNNQSVFYSENLGKFVPTINSALDNYWFASAREWKGAEGNRFLELLQFEGLGYQPRSGISRAL